ncbi:serine hydrolase domain-containing protein [Alienimonas californiensis]|uniref:Esterase EstB n=1 Tax=Alienimonas californiensis TaxID=2527989 RepID=A0A517P3M5_9PLAN|nr:serine hydrolase domain-containing protein [Alienimonas californiensis]QDT13976.1 Esterase EstB [Alienimonas californiensis]
MPAALLLALCCVAPEDGRNWDARLAPIDRIVAEGIEDGEMPGCVVLVGRRDGVVWRKAYGDRAVEPQREPMTLDTRFDLASLTKPVVTAFCVHHLAERGELDLNAPVAARLPAFGAEGKGTITPVHLLTHTGGLIADNALSDYRDGPDAAWAAICKLKPLAAPGERFVYSDVGFITLGRLVEEVSGRPLDEYAAAHLFKPLALTRTGFNPPETVRGEIAPTERQGDDWLRGRVHDPRAAALGGVAGHAGLFATADDLGRFARMLLGEGRLEEDGSPRLLTAETVRAMIAPRSVPGGARTRGWDNRSAYSSNRGDLFSDAAFGHGGFTGTALWIDPERDLCVVFLSSRLHPDGRGSVNRLIGRINTVAAAALCEGEL